MKMNIILIVVALVTISLVLIDQEETIQNIHITETLRVVTINTWLSWDINEGDIIYINIVNGKDYPEKTELIKDVILSKEKITLDKKLLNLESEGTLTYYIGWAGALEKASKFTTERYIPQNLKVITTSNGAGEIIINLKEESNIDGKIAETESISDRDETKIIKATITVYDINYLSDSQLQGIIRHELGHAFGLKHSTDPDDLMYKTLGRLPYVSTCDANAITMLYDGVTQSKVLCVK